MSFTLDGEAPDLTGWMHGGVGTLPFCPSASFGRLCKMPCLRDQRRKENNIQKHQKQGCTGQNPTAVVILLLLVTLWHRY
jgi:hypothetical protein